MSLLVAVSGWNPSPWIARLQDLLPGRRIDTLETLEDRSAVRYALAWRQPPGSLAELPKLDVIFSLGAGVDHILADPELPGAPLLRVIDPDLTARMSEWVVMNALLHHRQFRRYDSQQREAIWAEDEDQPPAGEVTVGLLGLGELGSDAARKLQALGFDVAGWARSPKTIAGLPTFHGAQGLDALLARTDILICLLPLTRETRGLLNAKTFAKLRRSRLGPFVINAGRGGLQVEADIVAALDAGILRGASLDVFETEPLPPSSPLWGRADVFITPHNSAISSPAAVARGIAAQILAFERGEGLREPVDRARGY